MGTIIVGVDESAGAAEALRWAAEEGQRRGWTVQAVLCWGYLDQHHAILGLPFDPNYREAEARAALDAIVASVLDGADAAVVDRAVIHDLAPRGLLERSADADLLVLGARGLGGFRELAVGSVSRQCLHHATIPVAIVRPHEPAADVTQRRIVVGVDGSPSRSVSRRRHPPRWMTPTGRRTYLTRTFAPGSSRPTRRS